MRKTIFVTGATSGFGKACAEKFAADGNNVIITGRRNERLQDLKTELEKKYNCKIFTLCFDVQNREATFAAIASLPAEWQTVNILINNAGLALGRDYFDEADMNDWETMIDTNVKGILYVTKALLLKMIESKTGHIINIGSTAGVEVYEKGNVYCASKSAVRAISQAMRIDLLRHRIKVTVIEPGAAETEFGIVRFKGDAGTANKVYEGLTALSANDVADAVYYTANLPTHVCINEMVLTCTQQANSFYFNRY